MGIDAQRSGASELPVQAVEVRRGRIAYPIPSGCPGTPWYARREEEGDVCAHRRRRATEAKPAFWAVQPFPNERWQSPAFWAVQPSPNERWQSPAFWAVQPSPNERWQSPARPMRPSGSGGAGASASLPALDDVHRRRLRSGARASAPAALGTRPLVVFSTLLAPACAAGQGSATPSRARAATTPPS